LFYLDNLLIRGFRNYRQQQLQFNPRLNIVIGKNAQGKTNLLESIYYLSVNRSFRTNRDQDLANWDDNYFFVKGVFIKDGFEHTAQASYREKDQLKVLINNNPANRYDHLQLFPVVVFSPDDLQIIREGPSIRRRFINLEASRLDSVYFKDLKAYQRVLLQRNHLLKEKHHPGKINELLEPWDQSLTSLGSSIIQTRLEIIDALEKEAHQFFAIMTDSQEKLSLDYISTVEYSTDPSETKYIFLKALLAKRDQEIKRGITLLGPHLDDLRISINGYDTRYYSSQAQKRTAALALKMAEVNLFKKQNCDCPIILLDDVFSELDNYRKEHLLSFLKNTSGQCFITTAVDFHSLGDKLHGEKKIFSVYQGSIADETVKLSS
jgi:DNA replication and repair protein RecF